MTEASEAAKDQLAQSFLGEIQDWKFHGKLPASIELADGIKTPPYGDPGAFRDFGAKFSKVESINYGFTLQGIQTRHPEANIVTVFPYEDEDKSLVKYHFRIFSKDLDIRSEFTPARVELLMSRQAASRLVTNLRKDPKLLDRVIAAKFPDIITQRARKPWKELIYLPHDKIARNTQEEEDIKEILATR